MKKFLIIAIVLVLLVSGLFYAVYCRGLYIDFHPEATVNVQSKTEGKKIYIKNKDGGYKPLVIKGVDLQSSIPGHNENEFAVDKETWLRWFAQIQEMGANTIRIFTIYNDTFYDALFEYNSSRAEPLYLLQGLQVSDYANNSGQDAYSTDFYGTLTEDSIRAVDVIHGRKSITSNRTTGNGFYWKDVSPWVLGYIVGNEWNPGIIAYTNHKGGYLTSFEGTYFRTTEGTTAFEALLAKVMDDMVSYESKKYKVQRLISFINDPQNDPFVYDEFYAKQIGKYNRLDAENILPTGKLRSGYFASYRLYKFCPGFLNYFSINQKANLSQILPSLNQSLYYEGYTELLARYHSMPVVITGYGFSSSRGTDDIDGPLTEEEQGKALVSTYEDIISSGCSGAVINTWQDEWQRSTWNTSYAVDVTNAWWNDIQTNGQGYGLLSFDSGEKKSAVYVDGDSSEWEEKDRVLTGIGGALSVRYDDSALYLLVEKKELNVQTPLYIPIDITPKSGSKVSQKPKLSFEREADFLICLDGRNDSRILVQARYESLRENYLMQIQGEDPYINYPAKDSPEFVPIRMICRNTKLVNIDMTGAEIRTAHLFNTYETGKLVYGNSNPDSSKYNSRADFYYGTGFFEIRIPWQLLNFINPADMEIHDDYYKKYGVEGIPVSKLYIGLCEPGQKNPASMSAFNLKGWGKTVNYHERLKRSYYLVKEDWDR